VPNLGTEHRTQSTAPLDYRRDIARGITREVGPIQALHGTSSLGDRIQSVGQDGVCKVNFYTAMTRDASARVKAGWDEIPADRPLPISRACGGSIHVARRSVFAEKTQSMMELLVDVG
jgi:fructose-bisphosphate aldolase class II